MTGNDVDRWKEARMDPVLSQRLPSGSKELLRSLLVLFPRPAGEPAFDPRLIDKKTEKLQTCPNIDTGYELLDRSVKIGLVSIDETFQGDHPKYGVKGYSKDHHDGFPPTIIAALDALSTWGLIDRGKALLLYWLTNFIKSDGTISYYGPSLSEYGKLLHMAILLFERGRLTDWWRNCLNPLERIVNHLLHLYDDASRGDGLIAGSPEADEREKRHKYFHNNFWIAKGLSRWAYFCEYNGSSPRSAIEKTWGAAKALLENTRIAIAAVWPSEPTDWWYPPQIEPMDRPDSLTASRDASYTNYRYWPEILSSGMLSKVHAHKIVESRRKAGGQFCGMTRFLGWLDDWPLADYLYGLWWLGRKRDFLLSLFGHIAYHQAKSHLTAYEQVTFPPGKEKAPYCLPCQLVAARAGRMLVAPPPIPYTADCS